MTATKPKPLAIYGDAELRDLTSLCDSRLRDLNRLIRLTPSDAERAELEAGRVQIARLRRRADDEMDRRGM